MGEYLDIDQRSQSNRKSFQSVELDRKICKTIQICYGIWYEFDPVVIQVERSQPLQCTYLLQDLPSQHTHTRAPLLQRDRTALSLSSAHRPGGTPLHTRATVYAMRIAFACIHAEKKSRTQCEQDAHGSISRGHVSIHRAYTQRRRRPRQFHLKKRINPVVCTLTLTKERNQKSVTCRKYHLRQRVNPVMLQPEHLQI